MVQTSDRNPWILTVFPLTNVVTTESYLIASVLPIRRGSTKSFVYMALAYVPERPMGFDDYKVMLYRNQPEGWAAEVPAIPGCYALRPTREEYKERIQSLPADTTEIVHA